MRGAQRCEDIPGRGGGPVPPGGVGSTATAPGAPNCSSPPVTVPEERCTSSGVEPWMGREGIEKLEGIHGCEVEIYMMEGS